MGQKTDDCSPAARKEEMKGMKTQVRKSLLLLAVCLLAIILFERADGNRYAYARNEERHGFCFEEQELIKNVHTLRKAGDSYHRRTSQGMCVAGSFIIYTRYDSDQSATTYVLLNKKTGKEVAAFDFHTQHSNSLTYNPDDHEVVSVSNNHAYVFGFEDGKLWLKEDVVMNHNCCKIAYIQDRGLYYLGTSNAIYSSKDFRRLKKEFSVEFRAINQGMGYDGKHLYINWYRVGNNSMSLYTIDGRYEGSYNFTSNRLREVEEVDFDGDRMILNIANSGSDNGLYYVKSVHDPGEWRVTEEPTCAQPGVKVSTCRRCGVQTTGIVPPTGKHVAGEWKFKKHATCEENGLAVKTCETCGKLMDQDSIAATGHTMTEWAMEEEPTVLTGGLVERHCEICGMKENRFVDKLPAVAEMNIHEISIHPDNNFDGLSVRMNKGDYVKRWISSDANIVSVTSTGTITGKSLGTAQITAITEGGVADTCDVTVKLLPILTSDLLIDSAHLTSKGITLSPGAAEALSVIPVPATTDNKTEYSTSDSEIAQVDETGLITAGKAGTCVITVRSGFCLKEIKIKVRKDKK